MTVGRSAATSQTTMTRNLSRAAAYRWAFSVVGAGTILRRRSRGSAGGRRVRHVRAEAAGRAGRVAANAAFEFRIGRYRPNVDNEFQTAAPYEQTFGNKSRYSIGFEVDWQALRIPYLGTLGPGFGFEYTKSSAQSFVASDPTLQLAQVQAK